MTQIMRKVRVIGKRLASADVCILELADERGEPLAPFAPGAHVDVLVGENLRQYSLCSSPDALTRYRIAVLKEPASRGGSRWLHDSINEGDVLQIGAPRNLFPLLEGAHPALLIAGGIGVTPLLAMAQELHRRGCDFTFVYCVRARQSAAFLDELMHAPYASKVVCHVDEEQGRVLDIDALLSDTDKQSHIYVCGPNGLMDAVENQAKELGWLPDHIHQERFSPPPPTAEGNQAFRLVLRKSGKVVDVKADQSALDALLDAGVPMVSSCGQGYCGSCLTTIVEGMPDHRDQFMLDEEREANDSFTPCCSRALSPVLVIDL